MSATLSLKREGFGIELRRGTFDVFLDGQSAGFIGWHETLEVPIEPGHHNLQIRAGRYSSHDLRFEATDGEVVNVHCHGAMVWPRYVASIVMPDLAISLKRE